MATVEQTVESGIIPIVVELNDVVFFESSERLSRTFLTINSLELGVLGYEQYRCVARRSKQANKLAERHITKLMRIIPTFLVERPEISCYIVPVYPRLLNNGELTDMLVKALSLYPKAYASKVCIELPSDILYDDLDRVKEALNQIRALGFKIAISEIGDAFCPVFRLSELPLDYVFLDKSAITRLMADDDGERVVGGFISYLKGIGALVFAPDCYKDDVIAALRRAGCDGCVGSMDPGTRDETEESPLADENTETENTDDVTPADENTEDAPKEVETTSSATEEIGGGVVNG